MTNKLKTYLTIFLIFAATFVISFAVLSFLSATKSVRPAQAEEKQIPEILFPGQEDLDEDGLTTEKELEIGTDPTNPDTDNDGFNDGQELFFGYNPIDDGPTVRRRLLKTNVGLPSTLSAGKDSDGDGLSDQFETSINSDYQLADTDGDGFNDAQEIMAGFDPTTNSRMSLQVVIDKINVNAPVVHPTGLAEADFQKALEQGVITYPGTALPGQAGNSFVTGHSSDYFWKNHDFTKIFSRLNELEIGDSIKYIYTLDNGYSFSYEYQVTSKSIVTPSDPALFADTTSRQTTVVTCWPLGTSLKRLMVKAEMK